jgi:hypothetical protein
MTAPRNPTRAMPRAKIRKQVCFRLDDESQAWIEREALMMSAKPPYHDISLSDILRMAVREYRQNHGDSEAPAPRQPCDIVQGATHKYCTVCFSRSSALADDDTVLCRGSTR